MQANQLTGIVDLGKYFRGGFRHVGLQVDLTNQLTSLRNPRTITHNLNGAINSLRNEIQCQLQRACQLFGIEQEILIAYNGAISIIHHTVVVILQVVGLVEVGIGTIRGFNIRTEESVIGPCMNSWLRTSKPTGDSGGMTLEGIETLESKTIAVVFSF